MLDPRPTTLERRSGPSRRRRALPAAIAALALTAACGEPAGEPATGGPLAGSGPVNLLLVTLDTTGADELGCYGNEGAETPNLDRLAAAGALVERAVAVTPVTLPSHASLLTGLYPPVHGVRDNSDFRLPPSAVTLAERLRQAGYSTAAAVAAYVLSADFGLDQGFDAYNEPRRQGPPAAGGDPRRSEILERPAGEVTDAAIGLLEGALPEPFFLWAHYFDPHVEYDPPEPFASRFADRPYDGEIAYMDRELGRLLDELTRRGLEESTLVVVTADHGESLGEHGENTHGLFVYEATQRVPLLLRWPGRIPAGTRVERLVSGVDLPATVLDLLGLPPLTGGDGASFAPAARGESMAERQPVYAEARLPERAYGWAPPLALTDRRWKYIEAPEPELYDLADDPGELTNLAGRRAGAVADWRQRLKALETAWAGAGQAAERPSSPEELARLRDLGYLAAGQGAGAPGSGDPRRDPKRLVHLHDKLRAANTLLSRGEAPERARRLLDEVLAEDPANPAALALRGTLLCSTADCAAGIEQLEAAVRRAPGVASTRRNLARALHRAGRLDEAAAAYRETLELQPFSAEDHYALGNVLIADRDAEGAIAAYRQALATGASGWAPVHAALGVALLASGDADGGRGSLRTAVELDPRLTDGWNALGNLAESQGDLAEARRLYATALETDPRHPGALLHTARIALRMGDLEPARAGVERLVAIHPGFPQGRLLEAEVALARGDRATARRALERLLALPRVDPRLTAHARRMLADLG